MKLKNIILPLFSIALVLGLSGCGGDESSAQSCKITIESSLDSATSTSDYDAVIALVEGDCSTVLSSDEADAYKVAAYFGQLGFDINTLASDIATLSGGGGNATEIVNLLTLKLTGASALLDSINGYKAADCNATNLTSLQEDLCAWDTFLAEAVPGGSDNIELAAKASALISEENYVDEEGNEISPITALQDPSSVGISSGNSTKYDINANGVLDDIEISGLSLSYAINNGNNGNYTTVSGNGSVENSTILFNPSANVTFTNSNGNYTYELTQILIDDQSSGDGYTNSSNTTFSFVDNSNGTSFKKVVYKLVSLSSNTTATTSGYCNTSFVTCTADSNSDKALDASCYPCPIISSNGTETSSVSGIVDILNSSTESDIITTMKDEIIASNNASANATITADMLAQYLQTLTN